MKLNPHTVETSDLELAMVESFRTTRAKRQAWHDTGPRAYEKHARIARAAERARKVRQQMPDDA